LRSQYSLAYAPPRRKGGSEFRRIKVRVKRPNLAVRTREGYIYDEINLQRGGSDLQPD